LVALAYSILGRPALGALRAEDRRTSMAKLRGIRGGARRVMASRFYAAVLLILLGCPMAFAKPAGEKTLWKQVQFAIVRFNDEAPQSWNIYHTEKRGVLLVKLWKRYLLLNIKEQEAYEVDPQTVKPQGDNVEWSTSDLPSDPVETSEWKVRDVGLVERVRFRFGKTGHFLEIQLPLKPDGKPAY
jgi:hypothetical protein